VKTITANLFVLLSALNALPSFAANHSAGGLQPSINVVFSNDSAQACEESKPLTEDEIRDLGIILNDKDPPPTDGHEESRIACQGRCADKKQDDLLAADVKAEERERVCEKKNDLAERRRCLRESDDEFRRDSRGISEAYNFCMANCKNTTQPQHAANSEQNFELVAILTAIGLSKAEIVFFVQGLSSPQSGCGLN
jgi:hypothetical protein